MWGYPCRSQLADVLQKEAFIIYFLTLFLWWKTKNTAWLARKGWRQLCTSWSRPGHMPQHREGIPLQKHFVLMLKNKTASSPQPYTVWQILYQNIKKKKKVPQCKSIIIHDKQHLMPAETKEFWDPHDLSGPVATLADWQCPCWQLKFQQRGGYGCKYH